MSTITLPITTAIEPLAAPRVPVRVEVVQGARAVQAWARYVESSPQSALFHHPDWSEAVQHVFGHRPWHLLARRGDQVVGVLPLMEVNSLLAGRLLLSVPYGTYGGIIADDVEASAALAEQAVTVTVRRRARVLELRSAAAQVPEFAAVEGYLGFRRELPSSAEDVAAFLPKRARAAARHARDRDDVVVQHDAALAPLVWELYCRSMRRIASINYPYRFFEELFLRLGEQAWASVAWLGERPVAGTISFAFRDTLMPYVLGVDERIQCDGATNLLYWSVMERAVAAGLRWFDYGRSRADNTGAVGFKKNQGFEPEALGYQRFVPPGQQAPDLKPSNPRYAVARQLWKKLPLPLTRPLGAWLARSIPG